MSLRRSLVSYLLWGSESDAGSFHVPVLSTIHKVVSAHPWLSISSSGSVQLCISGEYSLFLFSASFWKVVRDEFFYPATIFVSIAVYSFKKTMLVLTMV